MAGMNHREADRPRRAPRRMHGPSPARMAAFDVLRMVEEEDSYANLILPEAIAHYRLNREDAALATELTNGTLRWRLTYEAIAGRCMNRSLDDTEPAVVHCIVLGIHQLLNMRIPDHATVDQMVSLAKKTVSHGAGGFVNAVLRSVQRLTWDQWLEQLREDAPDTVAALSLTTSHPEWIVEETAHALAVHGRDADELEAALRADNVPPPLNLLALPGVADMGQFIQSLERGARPHPLAPDAAVAVFGNPGKIPAVKQGKIRIQDAGSQLVARALAAAPTLSGAGREQAGGEARELWFDACAGPGGKAALLTALAAGSRAHLTAQEVHPHRARLVEQALAPLDPAGWKVRVGDSTRTAPDEAGRYDRIMVDVPCSGLGALRRRPEARWRKQPGDITRLADLQRRIARASAEKLAPGGVMAYVTCSPAPAETVEVVRGLLAGNAELELLDSASILAGTALPGTLDRHRSHGIESTDGSLKGSLAQLWPHLHGTDAMFLALIRRKAPATPGQEPLTSGQEPRKEDDQ